MADSVLRHTDDDGVLSIFASGDDVLFACSKGHWWIVEATSTGSAPRAAAKRAREGVVPQRVTAADKNLTALSKRFGRGAVEAMSFK